MHIEAYQKLTLLDYPGKTAAIIFTHGCNFRCPFCHNAGLVIRGSEGTVPESEVLEYLEKRKKLLDGICITGGEPLLQKDIADFIIKVKNLGYSVKLDTNGSFPERLEELIFAGIIDYVAMDIKNSREKYPLTAGAPQDIVAKVEKSVNILMNSGIDYEFRTTVCKGLHTPCDMAAIGEWIKGAKAYYLQPFKDSGDIVCGSEKAPDFALENGETEALLAAVKPYIPNSLIRG